MEQLDKLVVFKDEANEWRWHRVAANGERVATSGEAFDSKDNAKRAAMREADLGDGTVGLVVEVVE